MIRSLGIDGSRDQHLRLAVEILGRVIIVFAGRHDFTGNGGLRFVISQYADLQLAGVDEFLDNHLGIVAEGGLYSLNETFLVRRFGDADARAQIRGLDEHWIAKLVLDVHDQVVALSFPRIRAEVAVFALIKTGIREQLLHDHFIHSGRGGQHSGANVRDIRHLEQPLNCAVLAVRSVEQREHDVDLPFSSFKTAEYGIKRLARIDRNLLQLQLLQLRHRGLKLPADLPQSLLADIKRDDLVFIVIKGVHNGESGLQRHLMLSRFSAVCQTHRQFCLFHSLTSFRIISNHKCEKNDTPFCRSRHRNPCNPNNGGGWAPCVR
ncbi:hypothetical protein D3C71_1392680 [compost metagenome]